jgi:hypothetical protein
MSIAARILTQIVKENCHELVSSNKVIPANFSFSEIDIFHLLLKKSIKEGTI